MLQQTQKSQAAHAGGNDLQFVDRGSLTQSKRNPARGELQPTATQHDCNAWEVLESLYTTWPQWPPNSVRTMVKPYLCTWIWGSSPMCKLHVQTKQSAINLQTLMHFFLAVPSFFRSWWSIKILRMWTCKKVHVPIFPSMRLLCDQVQLILASGSSGRLLEGLSATCRWS